MAVKSATKKKLVEQGVAPEHAHLLATDRNMAISRPSPSIDRESSRSVSMMRP